MLGRASRGTPAARPGPSRDTRAPWGAWRRTSRRRPPRRRGPRPGPARRGSRAGPPSWPAGPIEAPCSARRRPCAPSLALMTGAGEHLVGGPPEAHRAEAWAISGAAASPRCLEIDEQLAPAPGALANADLEAHELLPALGRGADHDQPALGRVRPIGLTHAGLEAHPVGPDGDVSGAPRDHGAASGRGPPPDRPSAARSPKPRAPARPRPSGAESASPKSPVETPRRYSTGSSASRLLVRRAHRGRITDANRAGPAAPGSRSRTLGRRTGTGPTPVWIARSGPAPWRTTRWRPSSSRASAKEAPRRVRLRHSAQAEEAPRPLARGRRRRVVDLVALTEGPDADRSAHRRIAPPGGPGRLDTRHDTPPSSDRHHPGSAIALLGGAVGAVGPDAAGRVGVLDQPLAQARAVVRAASVTIWRRTMPCLRSIETWDL